MSARSGAYCVARVSDRAERPAAPKRHAVTARRAYPARALTLLEVLISIALIGMLMSSLLAFYWQTLSIRDKAIAQASRTQLVQQTLLRMASELRGALGVEKLGYPVQRFAGSRRSITFLTETLPPESSYTYFQDGSTVAPQQNLREVTWTLWIDPLNTDPNGDPIVGGLLRSERRVFNPTQTEQEAPPEDQSLYVRHELVAPELGYLEFRYFDGAQWSTDWAAAQGNPLPQQIQITIGFDSVKKVDIDNKDLDEYPLERHPLGPEQTLPNRHTTIVQLRTADATFASRLQNIQAELQQQGILQTGPEGTLPGGQLPGGDLNNEGAGP